MNRILLLPAFLFFSWNAMAQNIPVNHWRSHLPYKDGLHVTEVGSRIYCGSSSGLFYVDKSDNSIHGLSKVDGFSDMFVKTMAYDPAHDLFFIAYQDGNLDILHHGKIYNRTYFLKDNIVINSIYVDADKAYFCVRPSLSAVDAIYEFPYNDNMDIVDRYNNNNVNGVYRVASLGGYLYACSESGVKRVRLDVYFKNDPKNWADISPEPCNNIVSFNSQVYAAFKDGTLRSFDTIAKNWTVVHRNSGGTEIQSLEAGNGKMVMSTTDSVIEYAPDMSYFACSTIGQSDAIADNSGKLWLSVNLYGMISLNQQCHTDYFQPGDLPLTTDGQTAIGYHNEIWVSSGLFSANGAPSYHYSGIYMHNGEKWINYNKVAAQFMGMAKDSVSNHLWIASLDSSVYEFDPVTQDYNIYRDGNTGGAIPAVSSVTDVGFDNNDNLWVGLYRSTKQLAERKKDGTWVSIPPLSNYQVNKIMVDDYGYIWMVDNWDNNGIAIYNPSINGYTRLSSVVGSGGLPSNRINCIAKDKSGQVWMGTSTGVCVFSDPGLLWGNRKYDVQRPFVSSSNSGYLLAQQNITAVAIDGANRKWFGTNNGVYLFSADGTRQLQQFNTANSPLVSNQINAIAINGESGEVFFVTDKGIVSYRGTATDGADQNHDVYAFPNPVKPGYHGPIAIKGLVTDANVKITDVTGQLVYETTALGGQAIWNGQNFSGRDANSGVYLVFITNTDGTQTLITKIMIVR